MKLMPRKSHLGRVLQPCPPRLLLIEMKTLFTPALDIVLFLHRLASVPFPPTPANLAVLNRAVLPPRHLTDIRHQNINTALGHQNIVLRHQATVLGHQATVLGHQATVLRHQGTVLCHQATVLRHQATYLCHQATVLCHQATVLGHQATVLSHQATVLRHQGTVARHQPTLFHLAFLQFVAIHFGRF